MRAFLHGYERGNSNLFMCLTQWDGFQDFLLNVSAELSSHVRCNEPWGNSINLLNGKPKVNMFFYLLPLAASCPVSSFKIQMEE